MTTLSNLINIGKDFNMYSELSNTIENISTTITLTSTAFGKLHRITGTSADYTITLPAASGNNGKIIGFVVDGTATKLFTLDANSTETIDGETTRVLWANESAVLLCDGTGWTKIAGKTIPYFGKLEQTIPQSVLTNTLVVLIFQNVIQNVDGVMTTINNNFIVPRKSSYKIEGACSFNANGVNISTEMVLQKNDVTIYGSPPIRHNNVNLSRCGITLQYTITPSECQINDQYRLSVIQNSGGTRTTEGFLYNINNFSITEIPTW